MKDQNEKQAIEEMAKDICCICHAHKNCVNATPCTMAYTEAEQLYTDKGYRKQSVGEWEWFEEWSPSTPDHPRECDDCGWRCGECKTALEDIVGGYWDDPDKKPNLNFCPECGAMMNATDNNVGGK